MNNKEKRKYMTDMLVFDSTPFLSEFETRRDFLKKTPTILYKYRSFDEFSFEMIDEGYAFLAPVNGLDDPFDCLNDFSLKGFYNKKKNTITLEALDFIINMVCPNGLQGMSREEVRELAAQCITEGGIDYEKAPKIIKSDGVVTTTTVEPLFVALNTFNENFQRQLENTEITGFAENAMNPGDKVGVCSLSEKRDNKVMWSLYGDTYAGYCIEYEIPKRKEVTPNLCPVIYTKRNNNKFIKKMIEYSMGAALCAISEGHLAGNIGAAMELFCTKDTDWDYQAEWRILGKAKDHFKYLKIKSIYLGFKVSQRNERKMKRAAKTHGFNLYKMNEPTGSKRITYVKIV